MKINLIYEFVTINVFKQFIGLPTSCFTRCIAQCSIKIGNIYAVFTNLHKPKSELLLCNFNATVFYFVCCMSLTLFINPRPKYTKSSYNFSLCYWNLSSLLDQDFSKLSLSKHTVLIKIWICVFWKLSLRTMVLDVT